MTTGQAGRAWWMVVSAAVLLTLPGSAGARNQSVGVTTAGQAIAVERDGDFVRVRTPGQQVDVTDDWRKRVTVTRGAGDDLIVELGAREADGTLSMALSGDVLFDFNSTAIRPAARETLGKIAQVIRDRSRGDVVIVGHTDAVGADDYNQKLSEDRAAAVIAWLSVNEGIPASLMLGRGMGESKPVAHNTMPDGADNPQGREQNRRVEIFVATREDVDVRSAVEVTRVRAGGTDIVVERGADSQTIQVGDRTIAVQQGAGGQRVQVGDTVVDVPQGATAASSGAAASGASSATTAAAGRELRPASPVQCSGMRSVQLDSVIIETAGVAIEASGTCTVTIRNSEIRSQAVAITASGMATIQIIDSVVVGRAGSVGASGTAVVNAQGSEFRGAVTKSGLANFNDRGGNRLP